jgi:hypothetical protein
MTPSQGQSVSAFARAGLARIVETAYSYAAEAGIGQIASEIASEIESEIANEIQEVISPEATPTRACKRS